LKTLVNRAYDRAKLWMGWIMGLQILIFCSGVLSIFWPTITLGYPFIALPLAFVAAYISGRAGKFKGTAEVLKRHHEYFSGFGKAPSNTQLADLRQSLRVKLAPDEDKLLREGITYASDEGPGPKRVLENLSESAWFTKHLAHYCWTRLGFVFCVSIVVAITLLIVSATSLSGTDAGIKTAKCVSSTLLFLMSVGMMRTVLAYKKLEETAGKIDEGACHLLERGEEPTVFEAQRLLSEYQLARASAPLVPTWVWKVERDTLNENWETKRPKN
jgi:hypothetical protein